VSSEAVIGVFSPEACVNDLGCESIQVRRFGWRGRLDLTKHPKQHQWTLGVSALS